MNRNRILLLEASFAVDTLVQSLLIILCAHINDAVSTAEDALSLVEYVKNQ